MGLVDPKFPGACLLPSITETSQPQRSWQDRGVHTTPSHSAGWGKRPRQRGHAASRPPYLGAPSPSRWGGDVGSTWWPVSITLLRRTGPGKPAQLTGGSFPTTDELRATVWAPPGLAAAPPASVPPTPPWTSPRLGQDQAGSRLRLVLGSAEVAVGVTFGIILGGEGGAQRAGIAGELGAAGVSTPQGQGQLACDPQWHS